MIPIFKKIRKHIYIKDKVGKSDIFVVRYDLNVGWFEGNKNSIKMKHKYIENKMKISSILELNCLNYLVRFRNNVFLIKNKRIFFRNYKKKFNIFISIIQLQAKLRNKTLFVLETGLRVSWFNFQTFGLLMS